MDAALIGLLLLLGPIVVFTMTLPCSKWLRSPLRKLYLILGGMIVVAGSGTSLYLAMYSGDQGGIAAYFFQIAVISMYLLFSCVLALINWGLILKEANKNN